MRTDQTNSSNFIAFSDGTSSACEQLIVETTAPSDNLGSLMANWVLELPVEMSQHQDIEAIPDIIK